MKKAASIGAIVSVLLVASNQGLKADDLCNGLSQKIVDRIYSLTMAGANVDFELNTGQDCYNKLKDLVTKRFGGRYIITKKPSEGNFWKYNIKEVYLTN
jgi:hypothetical protein